MSQGDYWSGWQRRRLRRRQVLGGAVMSGGALALAACAGPKNTSNSAPSTGGKAGGQAGSVDKIQPGHYERALAPSREELSAAQNVKRGGTLKFNYLDPPHFDIALTFSCTLYDTYVLVYNRALRPKLGASADPLKLELEPDLAEKIEQPAKDGTEFIFSFRKNVKWQNKAPVNGRPFTAEDAMLSYQRYQSGGVQKDLFSFVDKWEMPDQYTLRAKLKQPFADFPASISTAGFIVPHELWMNSDAIKTQAVGTGPFIRDSWTPKQGSNFVRNPDYWEMGVDGKPLPYLDAIQAGFYPEASSAKAAYLSGNLDLWIVPTTQDGNDVMKSVPNSVWLDLPFSSGTAVNNFIFNLNNPKFKDKRVRNAISMGIDRVGMDRLLTDGLTQGWSNGSVPWIFAYDQQPKLEDQGPTYQYNPDQAKQLLKAAGADNLEFELAHFYLATQSPVIQNMLQQIGVKADIRAVDNATAVQLWTSKNFKDAINVSWGPPNFTADGWLYPFYSSSGGTNYNGVSDPDLDKMLDAQRKELDATKRKDILKQIDVHLHDQNYDIFFPQPWDRQMWSSSIKNFRNNGFMGHSQCYLAGEYPQVWIDKS
jgi:peptide/nickel transport system substrate-binding protein